MRTMIMDKTETQKLMKQWEQINSGVHDGMRFYVAIKRMAFNLSSNNQL